MPATVGRVKMPHKNRVHTTMSLDSGASKWSSSNDPGSLLRNDEGGGSATAGSAAAAAAGMQELSTMMGAGSKEVRHVEFQKDMVRQENVKGGVLSSKRLTNNNSPIHPLTLSPIHNSPSSLSSSSRSSPARSHFLVTSFAHS